MLPDAIKQKDKNTSPPVIRRGWPLNNREDLS